MPRVWWEVHQSINVVVERFGLSLVSRASSSGVRFPIHWLHCLCVSVQLLSSYGEPPRETGMISWISGECGSRGGSVLSTGVLQSQQT